MPDTSATGTGLLWELRDKIKDTAWKLPQFSIYITGATSAVLEIEENSLLTTVVGGGIESVDLTLSSSSYNTIEKLVAYLRSLTGYHVDFTESGDPRHNSTDLQVQAPIDILDTPYIAQTRRWSDTELNALLQDALRRHNSSVPRLTHLNYSGDYNLNNVPDMHRYFVVLLAQIEVLKTLIHDANKRRGTDLSVGDYDILKRSLEDEYAASLDRLIKSAEVVSPVTLTLQDEGDIVIGHSYRTRFSAPGYRHSPVIPSPLAPMPKASTLSAEHQGDGVVLLEWSRNRDLSFHKYELWRGTTDAVSNRSRTITPVSVIDFDGELVSTGYLQHKTTYIDGVLAALDPGLYYYRLYTYNRNGDYACSAAVSVTVE